MDMDWNLKKLGQPINTMPATIIVKGMMVTASKWNFSDIFFITLQEHFVYGQRHYSATTYNRGHLHKVDQSDYRKITEHIPRKLVVNHNYHESK